MGCGLSGERMKVKTITLPGMVLKDLENGNFKNGTAAPENKDNLR